MEKRGKKEQRSAREKKKASSWGKTSKLKAKKRSSSFGGSMDQSVVGGTKEHSSFCRKCARGERESGKKEQKNQTEERKMYRGGFMGANSNAHGGRTMGGSQEGSNKKFGEITNQARTEAGGGNQGMGGVPER